MPASETTYPALQAAVGIPIDECTAHADFYSSRILLRRIQGGDMSLERSPQAAAPAAQAGSDKLHHPTAAPAPFTGSPRVQIAHVNGIWRATIDVRFYGDFSNEHDAAAAVADRSGNASTRSEEHTSELQ